MGLPEEQLVLLHIEEQAMVQVIIKEVANHLDMKDSSKINTVSGKRDVKIGSSEWE